MIPAVVTVKHRSLKEFGPMSHHKGEEFMLVLRGEIELHSEHYNVVRLSEGESVYIDGTMPHAMISVGKSSAEVLSVCTHEIPRAQSLPSEAAPVVMQAPAPAKAAKRRRASR
jgi:mannose-6-phosphate isomerase-like protein (cupin superfamily)